MYNIKKNIWELEKKIEEVTECFYQQRENEGYHNFELVFPDLIRVVDQVALLEKEQKITKAEFDLISTYLSNALQALEEKDVILLSDIMRYDLIEVLNNITATLQ